MKGRIKEKSKDLNLSKEEKLHIASQYKEIENNFKDGIFNFTKLNIPSNKEYIEILLKYLEFNGYGFLCNEINKNITKLELAKLLIDSKLINKPIININSDLEDEILYERDFGYNKEFTIEFKVLQVPFEILNIDYSEKEYLHCSINNSKDTIKIKINIDEKKDITDRETIIVYTSLGVKEFTFTIDINNKVDNEITIKDFNEFKKICIEDISKANEIFNKESFRSWLVKKNYITQVINYDEAILLANNDDNNFFSEFTNFCRLNEINITDSEDEQIIKSKPINNNISTDADNKNYKVNTITTYRRINKEEVFDTEQIFNKDEVLDKEEILHKEINNNKSNIDYSESNTNDNKKNIFTNESNINDESTINNDTNIKNDININKGSNTENYININNDGNKENYTKIENKSNIENNSNTAYKTNSENDEINKERKKGFIGLILSKFESFFKRK